MASSTAVLKQENSAESCQFFLNPREAWDAMLADCSAAEKLIEFEQYIFQPDEVGTRFCEVFIAKAKQGVKVKLLLDHFGSVEFYFSDKVQELKDAGVEVHFFNTPKWKHLFFPSYWYPRTHVKMMLIDSKTLYIGGVCIDKKMTDWRDTHMRLEGPVAAQVRKEFDRVWRGKQKHQIPAQIRREETPFYFIASAWHTRKNAIYYQLIKQMRRARERIYLSTPYFMPTRKLRRYLARAAKRGVDVRLLLPRKSDTPLIDFVSVSYVGRILKWGAKAYFYEPTVLHGKVAMVDDWATVGSMNLDYLSLLRNRESNVMINDHVAVTELYVQFEEDLKNATEYTYQDWKNRPFYARFIGWAGRAFKYML